MINSGRHSGTPMITCALVACIFAFSVQIANSQTFTKETFNANVLHQFTGNSNGCGVSFYDFNKDGWDDISFVNNGLAASFFQNNGDGTFTSIPSFLPPEIEGKQITWVDFDNDGDPDISLSSFNRPFRLFRNNGNYVFEQIAGNVGIIGGNIAAYGHSWADFDLDGLLDLYISIHTLVGQENLLYRNTPEGIFENVTSTMGVGDGLNLTTMSVFADINFDGYPDLYVVNEGGGGPNGFYLNTGNGFDDVTEDLLLGYDIDGMSNSWADFDGDGDLDVQVSNGEDGNLLLRNEGPGLPFANIAAESGVIQNRYCWGSVWLDYDLDGWEDLYVAAEPTGLSDGLNQMFRNNGDGTFTDATNIGFQNDIRASHGTARGDYNNDGHPDIVVANDFPGVSDLWLNSGGSGNNYLKISLEGTISNRDGIGSIVEVFAGGMRRLSYTFCGESYLSQNSQRLIFGLSQAASADSVRIIWPSGFVDRFYDMEANQTLHIIEGSSLSIALNNTGTIPLCNPSILLETSGFSSYIWSDGSTEQSLEITEPGAYWVVGFTEEGLSAQSDTVFVVEPELAQIEAILSNPLCAGSSDGTITVTVTNPYPEWESQLLWNNGDTGDAISGVPAGNYSLEFQYGGGCSSLWQFELFNPQHPDPVITVSPLLCFGDVNAGIFLDNSEGNGIEMVTWNNGDDGNALSNLGPGTYAFQLTDTLGCLFEGEIVIEEPTALELDLDVTNATDSDPGSAIIAVSGGTPPYIISWSNGAFGEESGELQPGNYTVEIEDALGCESSISFEVELVTAITERIGASGCIALSPNPGNGRTTLLNRCELDYSEVVIYNLSGELLRRIGVTAGESNVLFLNDLPFGVYLVVIPETETRILYLNSP